MTQLNIIYTKTRSLVKISGEDKKSFLQGLITNDIEKLSEKKSFWSCFLTPQGKFLHEFMVFQLGEDIFLDVCSEGKKDLYRKLSIYKLRSKAELKEVEGEYSICFILGQHTDFDNLELGETIQFQDGCYFKDPRHDAMGVRAILTDEGVTSFKEKYAANEVSEEEYITLRYQLGIPEERDLPREKAILLENGFNELNAIDWDKGCYLGQELTARTKYRGIIRKRLFPVELLADGMLDVEQPVLFKDKKVGKLVSQYKNQAFILLRLEYLEQVLENPDLLSCTEIPLKLTKPDWITIE